MSAEPGIEDGGIKFGPRWPTWGIEKGYAALARYVAPLAVAGRGLAVGVEGDGRSPAELDRARAQLLFERLQEKGIGYGLEPRVPREGVQQVRHPQWLLDDRHGTCLDLAITYAAMCDAALAGALLAVTEEHAFVVITPGRLDEVHGTDEPFELSGFAQRPGEEGVLEGPLSALALAHDEGAVFVVEAVWVTQPRARFAEAAESIPGRGRSGSQAASERVNLIDFPYLHGRGELAPYDPPAGRPTIRLSVPNGGDFKPFDTHAVVVADLAGGTGLDVLLAPSGTGKSTIARHLAQRAGDGAAWFLDASEPQSLINSLAGAEMAENDMAGIAVPDAERKELSQNALGRLREAQGPWLVVLDNADGDPATLRGLVPQPGEGQQVLVTSTNPDWMTVPGYSVHELPPLDAGEPGLPESAELVSLIDGRPLLLEAFERLQGKTAWTDDDVAGFIPSAATVDGEALRGPAVYWAALRAHPEFDERELRLSAFAAFLPPNAQPLEVLEGFVPGASETVELLERLGLLTSDRDAEVVRMHRLLGAAVRVDLEDAEPRLCDEIALALATDEGARAALDRHGDLATISRLEERLLAIDAGRDGVDTDLGIALHGVAGLLELHGHTSRSGEVYQRAERHLGERRALLADCLHGRARTVNQHHADDEGLLREAVEWAKSARRILIEEEGENAAADRCLAMQGLLMKPLASFPRPGETKLELLHDALGVLEEADERRLSRGDTSRSELARSRFNLAGIRIPMAQADPERAEAHLEEGERIYAEVETTRRRLYDRDIHPHVAACLYGRALVGYYRALLVPASPAQQSQWLRGATESAVEALRQREVLEGSVDRKEAAKSAALLAKIALARHASPTASLGPTERLCEQAIGELKASRS